MPVFVGQSGNQKLLLHKLWVFFQSCSDLPQRWVFIHTHTIYICSCIYTLTHTLRAHTSPSPIFYIHDVLLNSKSLIPFLILSQHTFVSILNNITTLILSSTILIPNANVTKTLQFFVGTQWPNKLNKYHEIVPPSSPLPSPHFTLKENLLKFIS